jgi:imidazolonepropionase-like amidohydrolase
MQRTFLRGANLLDGTNPARPDVTIVLEGDRVTHIAGPGDAPAPKPKREDQVFEVAGKTVMPGMYFCHFHPAYDNVSELRDIDLKHPPTYLTLVAAKNAKLLLHSGYTGSVGAGAANFIEVQLRNAVEEGLIEGPRIYACGRDLVTTGDSVDMHPDWWNLRMEGLAKVCDGPDEFRKAVREEAKNGVDIVKLYVTGGHGLPLDYEVMSMSEAELEAAAEAAHERGKKIRGHIINKRGILASARAGLDIIDHGDGMDQEAIDVIAEHGSYVAPSLYFSWNILDDKKRNGTSSFESWVPEMQKTFESHARWLPELEKAGVPVLLGDDFGVGWMPHGDYTRELLAYRDAGIDPLTVLRWATRNGAAVTGRSDELGAVEVGYLADLLVVDGDPSQDLSVLTDRANLSAIVKGGEFVTCTLKREASAAQ